MGFSVVEIVDSSDITLTAEYTLTPPPPTGIETPLYANVADLYPNPDSTYLTIIMKDATLSNHSVMIYDRVGQLLIEKEFNTGSAGKIEIGLTELPAGIYLYSITDRHGQFVSAGRFVVTK